MIVPRHHVEKEPAGGGRPQAELGVDDPGTLSFDEEGGFDEGGQSQFQWFVDPLDGTSNFMQGLPIFSISIACRHGEDLVAAVVLDPVGDNLFTATLGAGLWENTSSRNSSKSRTVSTPVSA